MLLNVDDYSLLLNEEIIFNLSEGVLYLKGGFKRELGFYDHHKYQEIKKLKKFNDLYDKEFVKILKD